MNNIGFIKRCYRYYSFHFQEPVLSLLKTRQLEKKNRISNLSLHDSKNILEDVVVSLTTHGERINNVHITIESILDGESVPSRIILWLNDINIFNNLPLSITRLLKRGVEVKMTKNYGPHTKYYPYVSGEALKEFLVTADDDIIYPKYWLSSLYRAAKGSRKEIICHRAHEITFDREGFFLSYNKWKPCAFTNKSIRYFATGVSGVIYPLHFQHCLKSFGEIFLDKCPKADDVWLHFVAYKNDYKIKQLTNRSIHFLTINNTQHLGLMNVNVWESQNDKQIKNTYSNEDMQKIYSDD